MLLDDRVKAGLPAQRHQTGSLPSAICLAGFAAAALLPLDCCCVQDKLVLAGKINAADEPAPAVMLAPNPVKLAQQRKKSGTGSLHVSVPSSTGSQSHMGPMSTRGGPMGAKTLDRSRLRSVTGEQ